MSSIVYCGHDFSDWCRADVVERAACAVVADAYEVPGREGALLVSGFVPPVDVRVRLYLDLGMKGDTLRLADARHQLRAWLTVPEGGTLVLPDDPEVEYRDALLTCCSDWDSLFEGGSCELTFTLFDPIAWGKRRFETGEAFNVGGSQPTLPCFSLVAEAGAAVQVDDLLGERFLRIERTFLGGEYVAIDCAKELVQVDGLDARVDVTLGSDFFALDPGYALLSYTGCSAHDCYFFERWA